MAGDCIDTYEQVQGGHAISPYRAVQLLLDGAVERVQLAKQAQAQGDVPVRGLAIGTTITILGVLQASLDRELGGGIVENLDALYDYMTRRLANVALEQTSSSLDEVLTLLVQIKDAWDAIGPEHLAAPVS